MIRFQTLEWGTDDSRLSQTITTIHFSKVPFILCNVSVSWASPMHILHVQVAFIGYWCRKNLAEIQCPHSRKLGFSMPGQQPRPPLPSSGLSDKPATSSHLELPLPRQQGLGVGKTAILLLVGQPYLGI